MPKDETDIIAVRPSKYLAVCFTGENGKEVCWYLPTWELEAPIVDTEIPRRWPSGPPVIVTEGLGPLEDPRPAPWMTDLEVVAAAWGLVGSLENGEAAEMVQSSLKQAADVVAAAASIDLTVHFPS